MTRSELEAKWRALSKTTRREVLRGIREHGRCDGDWHGRESLNDASKVAAKLLDTIASDQQPAAEHVCGTCGSHDIQHAMWVTLRTNEVHDLFGTFNERDASWCPDCDEHAEFVTPEEWAQRKALQAEADAAQYEMAKIPAPPEHVPPLDVPCPACRAPIGVACNTERIHDDGPYNGVHPDDFVLDGVHAKRMGGRLGQTVYLTFNAPAPDDPAEFGRKLLGMLNRSAHLR